MLKATLIGNLGNDPEMRYSAGGAPFLRFNVASNYRARTPEGEWQDKTEWVRVTVFGQRAEIALAVSQEGEPGLRRGSPRSPPLDRSAGSDPGRPRSDGQRGAVHEFPCRRRAAQCGRWRRRHGRRDTATARPRASSWQPGPVAPGTRTARHRRPESMDDGDLEDLPF